MGKWAQKLEKELAYGDTTTKQTRTNAVKAISHLGIFAFYPYNSTTHRNHRISYQQLQMVQDDICHLWQDTHLLQSNSIFLQLQYVAWTTLNPEFYKLYTGL